MATLRELDEWILGYVDNDISVEDSLKELQALAEARTEKIEAIAYCIKQLEYWSQVRKEESDRLRALSLTSESKANYLKEYLMNSLLANNETKVKTKYYDISVRKAGGKEAIELAMPLSEVPANLLKTKTTVSLDKEKLQEAFDANTLPQEILCKVTIKERKQYLKIN